MEQAAQERGEDIAQVIGEDYKIFCDDIIAQATPKSLVEKAKESLSIIFSCLSILLLIQSLSTLPIKDWLVNGFKGSEWNYHSVPISLSFFPFAVLITVTAWLTVLWIGKTAFVVAEPANSSGTAFKKELTSKQIRQSVIGGAVLTVLIVGVGFLTYMLSDVILFSVHAAILGGVIIVLFLLGRWTR
ncbi:MAG: hypothetical protein K6T85_15080 [Gorillibacterium sp.]|nr:hypothetical protein [Gorillibacterium sp.]